MRELIAVHKIKKINLLLLALAHPIKRKIIHLIDERNHLLVGDLVDMLHLSQPIISQHLAILRKYKIVTTQRKGKHIVYSLDYERLEKVEDNIEKFD